MTFRTSVAATVELIMAHPVAMKTGSPIANVIVREWFVVLGQGHVRQVRRAWIVGDMKGSWERRTLSSKVV